MTGKFDANLCGDKGGQCATQSPACSTSCVGVVVSSGLKAATCSWDRNSECQTPAGDKGGKCTCAWSVPAGSSLQCGCGCK